MISLLAVPGLRGVDLALAVAGLGLANFIIQLLILGLEGRNVDIQFESGHTKNDILVVT